MVEHQRLLAFAEDTAHERLSLLESIELIQHASEIPPQGERSGSVVRRSAFLNGECLRQQLDRFVEFLPPNTDPRKVTRDDLTDFMVRLKNKHRLENNTVIHQMIIIAQFLKHHGKGGVTKNLGLPERVITLPREYGDSDLQKFFGDCTPAERVLFSTFLFTGFREQELVHLYWSDINFTLNP